MKKTLLLSVVASTMMMAGGDVVPAPVVTEEADRGEVFGQARSFYVDRTYSFASKPSSNRNAWAAGGYIGYKTPEFSGFTAAVAAYGTYGFELHDDSLKNDFLNGLGTTRYDPSLQGYNGDNYVFIGQAYVNYKYENTNVKAGRMRLDTPLAGADDARMLPNLFEAVLLSNTDVENTTLIAGHVFRETVGTFANVYMPHDYTKPGSMLALQSGYGLGAELGLSGEFVNMGTIALGDETQSGGIDNSTAGVSVLAATYTGFEGVKLQAWDYIAWNILNAVYLEGDYTIGINESAKVKLSAQYINETDIGDTLAGKVNTNYVAGKITGVYDAFSAYVALSTTGSNDDTVTNGGVITPWGGMPAYTQGMVTRHQFFANTNAWKVAGVYNLKEYGVKAVIYHTEFDIGAENTYKPGTAWTASESGWDVTYKVAQVDGLSLRARANYPRDFAPGTDWDEYRLILNYNF